MNHNKKAKIIVIIIQKKVYILNFFNIPNLQLL